MEKDKYLLGSVHNALTVMDLLSRHKSMSLAELHRQMDLDKSSVFRTLYTLEKGGYVEKTPDARYSLGMKFLYYGSLVADRQDLVAAARPYMQRLTAGCKLAAHLGRLNHSRVVTLHKEEPPYDIQVTARVGMSAPAHATAMGRAILSGLTEAQLEALLEGTAFKRYSDHSILSLEELRAALAAVRREGYAWEKDDRFPGFGSIACPLFDHTGRVCAAVGVVGMTRTIQEQWETCIAETKRTAAELSAALGWEGGASGPG